MLKQRHCHLFPPKSPPIVICDRHFDGLNGLYTFFCLSECISKRSKGVPHKNGDVHGSCKRIRKPLESSYIRMCVNRVPTRTGKPGKMGRHFPVREKKSGNFDQTGKVRENHTKYWKTEGISDKYYVLFFSDC